MYVLKNRALVKTPKLNSLRSRHMGTWIHGYTKLVCCRVLFSESIAPRAPLYACDRGRFRMFVYCDSFIFHRMLGCYSIFRHTSKSFYYKYIFQNCLCFIWYIFLLFMLFRSMISTLITFLEGFCLIGLPDKYDCNIA